MLHYPWDLSRKKAYVCYLNDSGHLLGEDVEQFDLSWDARAIFSVGKQS